MVSLIFYGWEEPVYIWLMIFSTVLDYINGYFVYRYKDQPQIAKRFVIISVVCNLGMLIFFKYFDFIALQLQKLHIPIQPLHLPLPLGISFYTFQTMTYTIDVYRKEALCQKNIIDFGAYVTMFPQLVAGPIVRYKDMALQLKQHNETQSMFATGIQRFIAGLSKKVLLANTAGSIFQQISQIPMKESSIALVWLGMFAFMFQIYFDFSGYSDMAIGLGKMLGFQFPENFNYPYIAKSIKEFWQRWHITLSSFFKDYVYIPLGGNRRGAFKTILNLAIVWLLTGFWHGASWNFVLWGMYFFFILVLEKYVWGKYLKKLPNFYQHTYAILLIVFGWVIFAFEDIHQIVATFVSMLGGNKLPIWNAWASFYMRNYILFWVLFIIASTPLMQCFYKKYIAYKKLQWCIPLISFILFLWCIASLVNDAYNPFLYFRF